MTSEPIAIGHQINQRHADRTLPFHTDQNNLVNASFGLSEKSKMSLTSLPLKKCRPRPRPGRPLCR